VRIGRILVGVLATIGGLTIIAVGFGVLVGTGLDRVIGEPNRFVSATPSPDGNHNAVRLTIAGGGGLSPFCTDKIFVVPQTVSNDAAVRDQSNEVYAGTCDFFMSHDPSPKIEWLSSDTLQITFSINSTALYGRSASLKKLGASGSIHVQFAAHE
jgi:hypothetical protein